MMCAFKKIRYLMGTASPLTLPLSRWERVSGVLSSTRSFQKYPSPTGRGWHEVPGEGTGGERKTPLPPDLLKFARKLRNEQTDAEHLLWELLRNRRLAGCKFRRQQIVETYILDFYCHETKLAIELDGGQHNEPAAQIKDEQRTRNLTSLGIRILRFWNNEVFTNTEEVIQNIYDALTSSTQPPPHPNPLPSGEGVAERRVRESETPYFLL